MRRFQLINLETISTILVKTLKYTLMGEYIKYVYFLN